jgi:hypothetical protein
MKKLIVIFSALIMGLGTLSCVGQAEQVQAAETSVSAELDVYYFHSARRCKTCVAVEENSKLAVETLYPEQVKAGTYQFHAYNLDEASSKPVAEKLGIGGQTLLVVYGDKKIDITSQGFMYATNPEKLKEEIRKAVEEITKG